MIHQAQIDWKNGQPFSRRFKDVYFSRSEGILETEHVFLKQNNLPDRWDGKSNFVIAETGFGTGLNFLSTIDLWLKTSTKNARLHYFSVEKFPLSLLDLKKSLSFWPKLEPIVSEFIPNYPPAVFGFHHIPLFNHRVILTLMLGDVEDMLQKMNSPADAWYLDGFAPKYNPEMWTEKVFKEIARLSKKSTTFSTFTVAGFVRRGLLKEGFGVQKVRGYGQKREILRGQFTKHIPIRERPPWFALPTFENEKKNAVIVGAGIAGITSAWALAKRGWQVELVDQNHQVAQGASGIPQATITPRTSLDRNTESDFYTMAYFKTLRHLSAFKQKNPDFSWQPRGVLQLASTMRILKQIEMGQFNPDFAIPVSAKEASALAGIDVPCKALYFPQAGWLNPNNLCEILIKDTAGKIKLHLNTTISRIRYKNNHWLLEDENGQEAFKTKVVILANALRALQFEQTQWLPISAARGQISKISATASSKHLKTALCFEGYVLPKSNSGHIIGATFVRGDTGTDIREADHFQNDQLLTRRFPGIFDSKNNILSSYAATRAVTPDRLPLTGPVPDPVFFEREYHDLRDGKSVSQYPDAQYLSGLFVNTGHGTKGLTSSFLCAELVAALVNKEPLPIPRTLYRALHPGRFLIRDLKKHVSRRSKNDRL